MKTPGPTYQRIAAIIARNHPDIPDRIPLANTVRAFFRGTLHGLAAGIPVGLLLGLTIGGFW